MTTERRYAGAGRVRLTALAADDIESMASWLPAALAPEWALADLDGYVEYEGGVLITDADLQPIGLAVTLLEKPEAGCATVPFLAVDPARRFRGLGGEAGIALDRHLKGLGYRKVYAPIPDGRGLAVYFWLRLGFRPLRQTESPGPVTGLLGEERAGIWMLSDSV
jgi:GNAT superfamily N-acetyltransferase